MDVSDEGNDPVTLAQPGRPGARGHRADQDVVALVVPGGAGLETPFPFGGGRALDRAGPLSPRERVNGSRAKKVVEARPKEADRRHGA